MKFALIGNDIPSLLPTLLTDLLFAGKQEAVIAVEEANPAMQDVLRRYGSAVILRSRIAAEMSVTEDRNAVLTGADCVIYAGDNQASSRFQMDRQALSGTDDDPGLSDQARVNGGIGGLLHTLRAGAQVTALCDAMDDCCPDALVICMGQPVGRMTELFIKRGYRTYGLGQSPLKGPGSLEDICRKMSRKPEQINACIAGLPSFEFLLKIEDEKGQDLMPQVLARVENDELGRLAKRWLDWYDAIAVGNIPAHAELLPAQEDYIPETDPGMGESVQQRKERILSMNTVGEFGASSQDGAMAQVTLLSKALPVRPVKLALALLRHENLQMEAVIRRNGGELPQLGQDCVIEAPLTLVKGSEAPHALQLPYALAETCGELAETSTLAVQAAMGDRTALRECVELDPAMSGLDRLYCQDVVDKMIEMHRDMLQQFA